MKSTVTTARPRRPRRRGRAAEIGRPRTEFQLAAVVHDHVETAGDHIGHVGTLAAVGPDDRLHVVEPPPAGSGLGSPEREPGQVDQADLAVLEAALVVRRGDVLGLRAWFSSLALRCRGPRDKVALPAAMAHR